MFGTLSGMLWSSNITIFLAEPYWSNGVILMYIAFSVLSLKASDSPLVPFVDFVSWDRNGRSIETQQQEGGQVTLSNSSNNTHSSDSDDESSDFLQNQERSREETLPMFYDESSNPEIHYRLPLVGGLVDEDNGILDPLLSNENTMRSRRNPRD